MVKDFRFGLGCKMRGRGRKFRTPPAGRNSWGSTCCTCRTTSGRPLLARDVGAMRDPTEGRFELGLGTGYVRQEFEAAQLPYPSARERIGHLQHVTEYMREHLPDVPTLIAGNGNRVLTVAAKHADIIGLTGGDGVPGESDPLAERIEFVRNAAPDRFDGLELNIAITAMPIDASGMRT